MIWSLGPSFMRTLYLEDLGWRTSGLLLGNDLPHVAARTAADETVAIQDHLAWTFEMFRDGYMIWLFL